MPTSQRAHAAHTNMLQTVRKSFGLKMPNLGDMRLNKSGTVGTEPIGKPNANGGIDKFTELKFGKLGSIDLPSK